MFVAASEGERELLFVSSQHLLSCGYKQMLYLSQKKPLIPRTKHNHSNIHVCRHEAKPKKVHSLGHHKVGLNSCPRIATLKQWHESGSAFSPFPKSQLEGWGAYMPIPGLLCNRNVTASPGINAGSVPSLQLLHMHQPVVIPALQNCSNIQGQQ